MTGGILDHQCLAIAGATCRRRLDLALAIQIGGGKGARFKHLRRRSLEHHFPTLLAGSGTDVHHIVGLGHDIFVMLHHDDRVAIVAELLEAIDEAIIVALVKSDRGCGEYRQGGDSRSDTVRALTTVESCHLHRSLCRHPQTLRRPPRIENPRLQTGTILLQRLGRQMRNLQGKWLSHHRDELPARCAGAL